jgi:hypothetical protein
MYSVIVENSFEPNFFTEKIIDALRTYTVPIYFGSPNIGKYFVSAGIIVVQKSEEFIEITRRLSVEDYWLRMPSMVRNFHAARSYIDILENLKNYIQDAFALRSG